jgi:hypothetical protein
MLNDLYLVTIFIILFTYLHLVTNYNNHLVTVTNTTL